MLFNSYVFIFLFLPVTLLVFIALGRRGYTRLAIGWVVLASLFFYGWWDPRYLWLIAGSMVFNYTVGVRLSARAGTRGGRMVLIASVAANLALLGYFKYTNFFINNLNTLTGTHFHLQQIILPLGISFFTFTQIAYLVDAWRGITKEYNLLDYCLFVVFFPHLIAGPIIHHKDVIPQFGQPGIFRLDPQNLAIGITTFVFGLFKKAVLADGIATWSTPMFDLAKNGTSLGFYSAWGGALAYTLQIYFDFSGYSDMAIGLSKMFGVRFPVNFNSPYQAVNIIEFWRRWHMTLSRFLRDYLYFSLGGNRRGPVRRYANLFITMLLGGLWHGAGWTFVIWGGLHGLYLMVNHGWQAARKKAGHDPDQSTLPGRIAGRALTFLCVIVAWVYFRADSLSAANAMLKGMARVTEIAAIDPAAVKAVARQLIWTVGLLAIVWLCPNTQHILARFQPAWDSPAPSPVPRWWEWRPSRGWAIAISALFLVAVLHLCKITEFLYFQF